MKFIKVGLYIILSLILITFFQQLTTSKVSNDYYKIQIVNENLQYNVKKILLYAGDKYDVDIFSPYYNRNDKSTILYSNKGYLENKNNKIQNVVYSNLDNSDEFKKIDNDIYYISKDTKNIDQFTSFIKSKGLSIKEVDDELNVNPYIYLGVAIIVILTILFLCIFEINRHRTEICIKKIFGKPQQIIILNKKFILLFGLLVVIKIISDFNLIIGINWIHIVAIFLAIYLIETIINYFEYKVYKSTEILKFINGENLDSIFLKAEYYILFIVKLLSLVIILSLAITLILGCNFANKYTEYNKIEDYYSLNEYLSKKDISQKDYINENDLKKKDTIEYESRNNFVNYMEKNYKAVYAYSTGNQYLEDDIGSRIIVSNEEYLKLNNNSELIYNSTEDYMLVPKELKNSMDKIKEVINASPLFENTSYKISYYDEINPSFNLVNSEPFTYMRPVIYVNKNNYNLEFNNYAYQALYFKGAEKALNDYYDNYNIKDEKQAQVKSKYNMYITNLHNIIDILIILITFVILTSILYYFIINLKIKSYFIANSKMITIKRLNGKKGVYASIKKRYYLIDALILTISIPMFILIYLITASLLFSVILLIINFVNLFVVDYVYINRIIRKIECSNIIETIKGE